MFIVLCNEHRIVKIIGNSMEPLLHDGDIAFVSKMDRYFIGDIIVFKYIVEGIEKLLSHRLIFEDEYCFYCKGDNSLNMEKVTLPNVLGKIISAERHGKEIQVTMRSEEMAAFCELSRNCGIMWKSGEKEKAIGMSRRCYITMLKICNKKGEETLCSF